MAYLPPSSSRSSSSRSAHALTATALAMTTPAIDKSKLFFIALLQVGWQADAWHRRLRGMDYGNVSAERVERLPARGGGLRVDQGEGDHTGRLAAVDPVVDGAALDQHVARLEVDLVALLELHVDLARDDHGVVDRVGAVHARRDAGRELDDAEDGAAGERGADFLQTGVAVAGVVGGNRLGGPHDAGRRTGSVRDDVVRDFIDFHDGASARVVPGDHSAYLDGHDSSLNSVEPIIRGRVSSDFLR